MSEETAAPITIIPSVDTSNDYSSTAILGNYRGRNVERAKMGREFSRMSPETKAVVFAIRAYYDWHDRQREKASRGLGYPSASAFADGYKGSRQAGPTTPDLDMDDMPPEHKDTLDALNSLPDIRRKVIECVHRHRLGCHIVARRINSNEKRVRNLIREAYISVCGFLRGRGRIVVTSNVAWDTEIVPPSLLRQRP